MVELLVELAGLALVGAFLVLAFHVWGVLAAGLLFLVISNAPSVLRALRARRERGPRL